jgi:tetratricopeptide (TPR) repeat protein
VHAAKLKRLGDALMASYHVSHSSATVIEAIDVFEEVLRLRPFTHEYHAESVCDLGGALLHFCRQHESDSSRSDYCIKLLREALMSRPVGHPSRDTALQHLAEALFFIHHNESGDREALEEVLLLSREAVCLRPSGHRDREQSLNVLAGALWRISSLSGDMSQLEQAISLQRERLQLCPPGHVGRDKSLNNLGSMLHSLYDSVGGLHNLAEAISLRREALVLRPPGHPARDSVLNNLGIALWASYSLQGNPASLAESICLFREALDLLPEAGVSRARAMSNLAQCLQKVFQEQGSLDALSEAAALLRHALEMQPPGTFLHDYLLHDLASTLRSVFSVDADTSVLSEAIGLLHRALELRPPGNVRRIQSLECLADVYSTPEAQSWTEALSLYREAFDLCAPGHPARVRLLSGIGHCFLAVNSPFFNLPEGISYLAQGYSDSSSHVNQSLTSSMSDMQRVEAAIEVATQLANEETRLRLSSGVLDLYAQVLGLLPRAANFGLDHATRLKAVSGTDELARSAASRALLLGRFSDAVELLEEGRGVFWAQTLHRRGSGLDDVPLQDREDLTQLLNLLEHSTRRLDGSERTIDELERDMENRRMLNNEAEALISKIRSYPGLSRFLLPPTFDSLISALPDGYVIILNASRLGHHALLLHRALTLTECLSLRPSPESFEFSALRTQLPRDANVRVETSSEHVHRVMRLKHGPSSRCEDILSTLWETIAFPILTKLGLQVGDAPHNIEHFQL